MPTTEEWRDTEQAYSFDKLKILQDDFIYVVHPENSFAAVGESGSLGTWKNHLINRLIQTRWSYVIVLFNFNKGIPDDVWKISPGRKGQTREYFPYFENHHHVIKAQFDYFADMFYFKLYSCWDTVGHLLNIMYDLKINKVDFIKAINKLAKVRPDLHKNLHDIIDSEDFKDMKIFRNGTTHNELLGDIHSIVNKVEDNFFTIGSGIYVSSKVIMDNSTKSLDLFANTLMAIRTQIKQDIE